MVEQMKELIRAANAVLDHTCLDEWTTQYQQLQDAITAAEAALIHDQLR